MAVIVEIILLAFSLLLCLILLPVGFGVSLLFYIRDWQNYLFNVLIGVDYLGNIVCSGFFNLVLIKSEGYQFGKVGETISSVLGKNKLANTLTILGKSLSSFLNALQKNHVENSIQNI